MSRPARADGGFDVVIIGAGPAGLLAARLAAREGARVALIERTRTGGTSLNTGSVPSKTLVRSARLFASVRESRFLRDAGVRDPVANLGRVRERLERVTARIAAYDSPERLGRAGIAFFAGHARFDSPASLTVGSTRLAFDKALVATGARAATASIPGLTDGGFLTDESVFSLEELPPRLAVVGGGPLGCELAQAFCRLGSHVTIIQDEAKFLPREERDAAQILAESMARDGVDIFLNTTVVGARPVDGVTVLDTTSGERRGEVSAEQVLVSIGRTPNVEDLGLELAGIDFDTVEGVRVDEFLRTSNPRVYAAGDVCMPYKFTHVAESTARMATSNLLGATPRRYTSLTIPWCTFCDPEIAHVGLQVWEARAQSIPVKTYTVLMQDIDRAITDRQDHGFVKIHVREGTDAVVGATIVASRASEMINELCVAISSGIGLRMLAEVVHTYPTQSEAILMAARACADEPFWRDSAPTGEALADEGKG
jgi:pyruvate/2-oxoglutarate dehydrogenase complex dihydrolipoamide dehydrogenase (E3) component